MVRADVIKQQLSRIGVNFQFFGHAELEELPRILVEGEQIEHVVRGRYDGGWAVLVATDRRVLLVDKKLFYLTIEDMRYDMIADVEFNYRLVDATIRLGTMNKTLRFTAFSQSPLRALTSFVQQQVMALRQQAIDPTAIPQQFAQFMPQTSTNQMIGQSALQGLDDPTTEPLINSYAPQLMVRRRVSRFY